MGALRDFFKGKKTYLVALAGILAALPEWAEFGGGFIELYEAVWPFVLAMTGRAALAKK